jgi:hypothetical protein
MVFLLSLFTTWTTDAGATQTFEKIRDDFRPVSGLVVKRVGEEFLINLDVSQGLSEGDLFAVVTAGESLHHPVTHEVIGTLDEVKEVLEVTRLKTGYSHARPLGSGHGIEPGDPVRRFDQMKAVFRDHTGLGEEIFLLLKGYLPALYWQKAEADHLHAPGREGGPQNEKAVLQFDLFAERLVVRGAKGQVLHHYGHPLGKAKAGDSPDGWEIREAVAAQRPDVKGSSREFTTLGTLPGAVLMGAFLENEDRLLLAATSGRDIRVYELTAVPSLVAVGEPTIPGRILSLHWWRPTGESPLYLALTMEVDENTAYSPVAGKGVSGAIFQFAQDKLTPVRDGLSFMLATFDRNGDGEPEILLAQEIDRDNFFGHRVRELLLKKGEIEAAQPQFTLPPSFPVQGSQFADLTGDGRLETIFVRDRTLYVYQGKKRLYQSTRPVGGSRSVLTHDRNPGAKDRLFTTITFEIPPAIAPVPGEGRANLMLAVQENAFFGGFGLGSVGGRNALASLRYEKGRFILDESGLEIEGSIQGLAVVRGHILLVVAEPGGSGGAAGKGHLLTTPW